MNAFTAAELEGMRGVQASAMMDRCIIRAWAPTTNVLGEEIEGFVDRPNVVCGLDVTPGGQEQPRPVGTLMTVGAKLRLSLADGEALSPKDVIVVTHRNGEALSPTLTYGLDGPPLRGTTGVVLTLVRAE